MEGRVRELLRLKAVRKAVSTAVDTAANTGETPRSGGVDTLQSLSALMDGEARDLELRRVLRHLESAGHEGADTLSADALRATWHRLHLARHALHGEETFANVSLLAGVRAAVDADPAPRSGAARGWLRAAGRCAVAASVAALVLVVRPGDDAPSIARVAPLPVGVANTVAVPVQASYGARDVPALRPADRDAYRELARQRLRRYSQEHAEHASLNTPQGVLPFARVPVIEAAQANELDEPWALDEEP